MKSQRKHCWALFVLCTFCTIGVSGGLITNDHVCAHHEFSRGTNLSLAISLKQSFVDPSIQGVFMGLSFIRTQFQHEK